MFKKTAVIGAGVMGAGIARHMAGNGAAVTLVDNNHDQLKVARDASDGFGINFSDQMTSLEHSDYIIEAVYEDLAVKHEVLRAISSHASDTATIASNTSSLLISDLATAVTNPNRFIGVHYNNPADLNPVVEVIPIEKTEPELTIQVLDWMKSAGKLAVQCADTPCFVLNRQSLPYINEAARCLDIATAGEVDHVATERLGVGLGPFAVMNLVGLPVMAASSRNLEILGEGYRAAQPLQEQAAQPSPDWLIEPVTDVSKEVTAQIVKRLRGAMIFPGQDILEKELCSREDLHMICKEALGYDKSSPELLEMFEPSVTRDLLAIYLANQ